MKIKLVEMRHVIFINEIIMENSMQKKGTIIYKWQLAKIQEMKKQWKLIFKSYMLKKNFGKFGLEILNRDLNLKRKYYFGIFFTLICTTQD